MRGALLALALVLLGAPGVVQAERAAPGDSPPTSAGTATTEVIGGSPAAEGAWPDAAALVRTSQRAECTGVLVAPNVVLTAGHCIDDRNPHTVVLDSADLGSPGESIPATRAVAYDEWWNTFDIGVLILSRDSLATPRTIATSCILEQYLADGAAVAIVGYGATDEYGTQYGTALREARTTIIDADCSTSGVGCKTAAAPGGELIAGGMGIDSCTGDSGGPLYLETPVGEFLVGITSRAMSDAETPCGGGGIYVRPDALVAWIEQTAAVELPTPTCNRAPTASADPVQVEAGDTVTVALVLGDPDGDSVAPAAIASAPVHGEARLAADGRVEYTAADDYEGPDALVVTITDDGAPPLTTEVQIDVEVLPAGCGGCAGGRPSSPGLAVTLLALWWVLRRRSGVREFRTSPRL